MFSCTEAAPPDSRSGNVTYCNSPARYCKNATYCNNLATFYNNMTHFDNLASDCNNVTYCSNLANDNHNNDVTCVNNIASVCNKLISYWRTLHKYTTVYRGLRPRSPH